MKFVTAISKTASTPPWANVVHFDGTDGFWVDTNLGQPMFLRKQDHVIWLPRMLRGKKIEDLTPEEVKALPKEDSGKSLYKQWRQQHENEQAVGKLHNGYQFSDAGLVLVDRLKKLVEKYELDDVANLGLDRKFSINPALFDKLMATNNRGDVQRIGRLIAKKFALVIHLLNQVNPKIAKRLDADFMFQYKKLQALFDFDVLQFKPNIPEPQDQVTDVEPTTLTNVGDMLISDFVGEAQPLLSSDPQLAPVLQAMQQMSMAWSQIAGVDAAKAIQSCQQPFHQMVDLLVKVTKLAPPEHPSHQAAAQVLNLPSLATLFETLFV